MINESEQPENYPRQILSLIVFGWLLLIFWNRLCSDVMLHQLQQPVLIFPQIDNTYWIFHYLQIPEMLTQYQWLSIAFDISVFALIFLSMFFSRGGVFPFLLSILIWIYYLSFNTFAGHHYIQVGLLFIVLPFIATDKRNFNLLFEAVRYYCCFLYASSGAYKLFRGAVFNQEQMSSILMNDNADAIYSNPNSFLSESTHYLIQHTALAQSLFILAALLELLFIAGFFTKKYDLLLLAGALTFHIGNYLFLEIPFLEQSIIFLTLIPKERWIAISGKNSK